MKHVPPAPRVLGERGRLSYALLLPEASPRRRLLARRESGAPRSA